MAKDGPDGELRITKVYPASPAGQANLGARTVITQINESVVEDRNLAECYQLLAGKNGTKVRLKLRDTEGVERAVELTRRAFLTTS